MKKNADGGDDIALFPNSYFLYIIIIFIQNLVISIYTTQRLTFIIQAQKNYTYIIVQ